ncbi:MAG: GNAT family N-acetyltransferase [Psychrobium sp.]|nr:GNAT family N-acetyltransferase [Psychrobium sp.]
MIFKHLRANDLSALSQFENENRAWFEQMITPRSECFYQKGGVETHIAQLLNSQKMGSVYSGLVYQNNVIVARVNLKNICLDSQSAEIGYRVAKQAIGRGVAGYGIEQMLKFIRRNTSLKLIYANVLHNNNASVRVLHKHKFENVKTTENFASVKGEIYSCSHFELYINHLEDINTR